MNDSFNRRTAQKTKLLPVTPTTRQSPTWRCMTKQPVRMSSVSLSTGVCNGCDANKVCGYACR